MASTHDRTDSAAWRHWYDLPQWKALARDVFRDAVYRCAMCKRRCHQKAPQPLSAVCDHITPHKGDAALFWNKRNLQCLCKECHDGPKRAHELRGWHDIADSDGWPIDPHHPANRGKT